MSDNHSIKLEIKQALIQVLRENLQKKKKALREGIILPEGAVLTKDLPERERIQLGKGHEADIIKKLEKFGKVDLPSQQEDIRFKLDGYITFTDPTFSEFSGRVPIQIKKRVQSGNDILFEVRRDFNNDTMGRDQKGNSTLYVVSNMEGKIGVFRTANLKEIVARLMEKEPDRLRAFRENRMWVSRKLSGNGERIGVVASEGGAQLRVTEGNPTFSEGSRKLIAFIPFDMAQPIVVL